MVVVVLRYHYILHISKFLERDEDLSFYFFMALFFEFLRVLKSHYFNNHFLACFSLPPIEYLLLFAQDDTFFSILLTFVEVAWVLRFQQLSHIPLHLVHLVFGLDPGFGLLFGFFIF